MREFIYGIIIGLASMYCYRYFDAPGILSYLTTSTEYAVKSTSGYGGTYVKKK